MVERPKCTRVGDPNAVFFTHASNVQAADFRGSHIWRGDYLCSYW